MNAKALKEPEEKPELEISDPIEELKTAFDQKTDRLEKLIGNAIGRTNQVIIYVIIVMAIGFVILLFSLATVLVVSWQANQSVHDAVQLQKNSH